MGQAPAPAAQARREEPGDLSTAAFLIMLFVMVVCYVAGAGSRENPVYHVAIDAVAGLSPATDLSRPVLYPEFDLRVRVDTGLWSGGGGGDACLELGSSAAVSYRSVPLAAATVPSRRCAGGAGSVPVVARGSGVDVPGDVRDALAWELWGFGGDPAGAAEFDVTLTVPYRGRWKVVSCKAKVGDAAALYAPCSVSVVGTVVAPEPQVAHAAPAPAWQVAVA